MVRKAENKQVSRVKSYKIAFGTEHGQIVLRDLMKAHNVLGPCFVKGDPYESALREGERNAVLRIFSFLKVDPIRLQMLIEKNEKENENE